MACKHAALYGLGNLVPAVHAGTSGQAWPESSKLLCGASMIPVLASTLHLTGGKVSKIVETVCGAIESHGVTHSVVADGSASTRRRVGLSIRGLAFGSLVASLAFGASVRGDELPEDGTGCQNLNSTACGSREKTYCAEIAQNPILWSCVRWAVIEVPTTGPRVSNAD